MTSDQICSLFEAFANYYWSVSAEFAAGKIMEWHPEVTVEQIAAVLKESSESHFSYHFCLLKDGLDEPEITVEHLYAIDDEDLDRFLAARIDGPYCECDEETLYLMKEGPACLSTPEVRAIQDFGKQELGLDDEWVEQLLDDCRLCQGYALCDRKSWVKEVLKLESYGKIRFTSIEQVRRFRDLGNQLYRAMPNPVLKGWKPADLEACPRLPDDIPETIEEIPDHRAEMKEFRDKMNEHIERLRGRDSIQKKLSGQSGYLGPVRRNDPCPCGSGKKYKKCCGKKANEI